MEMKGEIERYGEREEMKTVRETTMKCLPHSYVYEQLYRIAVL